MFNPGEGQEDRPGWVGGGGKLGSCSYSSTFTIVVVTLVFPTKSSAPRLQGLLQYIQAGALEREDGLGVVESVNSL